MKKTHDYIHHYRGYWSDGGKCRVRIYREYGRAPVVICSQLPDNHNTSVTNIAEYLAAEVIEEHSLPTPLTWIEHYPQHEGEIGEHSLVRFSSWELTEVCLGGIWRLRIDVPSWSNLRPEKVEFLMRDRMGEQRCWRKPWTPSLRSASLIVDAHASALRSCTPRRPMTSLDAAKRSGRGA